MSSQDAVAPLTDGIEPVDSRRPKASNAPPGRLVVGLDPDPWAFAVGGNGRLVDW